MRLSQRALGIGESATLAVSRRAASLRAEGVELADMSAGEPDFPTPTLVVDECVRALRAGMTRYAPAAGIPDLRRQLLETGDEELVEKAPRDYFWGCGASGSGKNMLGQILMEVRSELRERERQTA